MSLKRTLRTWYDRRIVAPRLLRGARARAALPRGRRGVLIMGWYGLETLGDKAILQSILQQLESDVRVIKATYDVDYSRETLRQIGAPHVECISNELSSFVPALEEVDVVIIGGGPLMGQREMAAWAHRLALARRLGRGTMAYGCGVGPIDSPQAGRDVGQLLRLADVITLRDETAVENAARLGLPRDRLTLTADPALGLTPKTGTGSIRNESVPAIGISLRSFPRKCFVPPGDGAGPRRPEGVSATLFDGVAHVANRILRNHDATLHLVPMQTHPADDDRTLLRELRERLGHGDRVRIIEDADSPAAMLEQFSRFDFLIGMRFHSVVFGLLTHTPLVAIDYDMHVGKVTGIMRAMGMSEHVINIGDVTASRLEDMVTRGMADRQPLREHIAATLPEIQRREQRNGALLRQLLEERYALISAQRP